MHLIRRRSRKDKAVGLVKGYLELRAARKVARTAGKAVAGLAVYKAAKNAPRAAKAAPVAAAGAGVAALLATKALRGRGGDDTAPAAA